MTKKGLGRGIGALIPIADENPVNQNKTYPPRVSISEITTNPHQPRKHFNEDDLQELAASIKEKGVLQPLLVCRIEGGGYELIAGERRLRAAMKAGLDTVPVVVKDVDDRERQEIALIENIQREDLNALEEAEAYQGLIKQFKYTQEEVAQKVGKSRSAVTNALRLLKLDDFNQELKSFSRFIRVNEITDEQRISDTYCFTEEKNHTGIFNGIMTGQCEFAILLHKKLKYTQISQEKAHAIFTEAVEIEIEFITESIPCKLIGMNSDLMTQYIKFVADF